MLENEEMKKCHLYLLQTDLTIGSSAGEEFGCKADNLGPVPGLGWEDLEEGMATRSSILAWRISMDRGAWWVTVHRSQRVGHD